MRLFFVLGKGERAGFRNQIVEIRNQAESNLFFKLFYLPQRSQSK